MITPVKNWFALFAALCALIGWTCATAASPKPVVIGTPLPLTGDLEEFGQIMKNSLELAREAINQAGGVHGNPVELLFADDLGKVSLAEKVVNNLPEVASTKFTLPRVD
jgi:branched-chain amino acid transport system substrate-binding protein